MFTQQKARQRRIGKPVAACALLTGLAAAALGTGLNFPAGAAEVAYDAAATTSAASTATAAETAQPVFAGALSRRESSTSRAYERPAVLGDSVAAEPYAVIVPRTVTTLADTYVTAVTVAGERATTTRLEVRSVTDPHERIERQDANRFSDLPPLVVQAGRDGELTRVYRYYDGAADGTGTPVLEIVASERQDEIVAIGTRARPAPAPFYGDTVTGGIPESVWVALAQCESGGRPSVISAGGRFHGLYQFSVATWRSVGGEGLPSEASPQEQRYRAVRLQARSGWGQWPSCSRRIGVR